MIVPAHAAMRAAERYGIIVTGGTIADVIVDITDTILGLRHAAILASRQHDGRERWIVRLNGVAVPVIYCPLTAAIVTVLESATRAARK